MSNRVEISDQSILDLLRQAGSLGIADLTSAMQVTATAVRQRLNRLMGQGLVRREVFVDSENGKSPPGRPGHRYSLTDKARRQAGTNFSDLALALWQEIRGIQDPDVRGGLLKRIAKSMAAMYRGEVHGRTTAERMQSVGQVMSDRNVPFTVEGDERLPVLTAVACPYPELAEQDRGICAVENMLLSELVGQRVHLAECRLDGANCCRFQTS